VPDGESGTCTAAWSSGGDQATGRSPLTKAPLRYDREAQELISEEAGLAYPIRDGIPIMLVDEARPLRDDETPPKRLPQP